MLVFGHQWGLPLLMFNEIKNILIVFYQRRGLNELTFIDISV